VFVLVCAEFVMKFPTTDILPPAKFALLSTLLTLKYERCGNSWFVLGLQAKCNEWRNFKPVA
jgi:hypothetical protein